MARKSKGQVDLVEAEQSALDKKVEEVVSAYGELTEAKEKISALKDEIMPLMVEDGRLEIAFDGLIIRYKEGTSRVTVSKEPNKE